MGRGDVHRVDSIADESDYSPTYPGSHSALTIPMKYHKQLIGTLGLESVEDGAEKEVLTFTETKLAEEDVELTLRRRIFSVLVEILENGGKNTVREENPRKNSDAGSNDQA